MKNSVIKTSRDLNEKLAFLNRATHITVIGPHCQSSPSLKTHSPVVFIDGGAIFFSLHHNNESHNYLFLGDGDSLPDHSPVSKESFDILLSAEKDQSDLEYFLNLSMENVEELTLHGFSGGDFDHELSNLGAFFSFLEKPIYQNRALTINVDQKFIFKKSSAGNNQQSRFDFHGGFSLFTLENQPILLNGNLRYQGEFSLARLSSRGLSNSALGIFQIKHSCPVVLIKNQRS